MNRWIFSTIFFLFFTSQAVLETSRILEIIGNDPNRTIPVWMNDVVVIVAKNILVSRWFFNNITIAELYSFGSDYNYSNMSLLNNITASAGVVDGSLTLNNVNHVYTGMYKAEDSEDLSQYSLNMTVHGNNLCKFIHLFI